MAARYHFRCDFLPEVREFIRDTALNKHDTGWAKAARHLPKTEKTRPPRHGFGTRHPRPPVVSSS